MTFDDGILKIYRTENAAKPGEKPINRLVKTGKYYFGYATIGVTRYYEAMKANQKISAVVNIPDWGDIKTLDLCELEDGSMHRIGFVQPTRDENGLKITKLTLERIDEAYEKTGDY